jgi:hypothetical protein
VRFDKYLRLFEKIRIPCSDTGTSLFQQFVDSLECSPEIAIATYPIVYVDRGVKIISMDGKHPDYGI